MGGSHEWLPASFHISGKGFPSATRAEIATQIKERKADIHVKIEAEARAEIKGMTEASHHIVDRTITGDDLHIEDPEIIEEDRTHLTIAIGEGDLTHTAHREVEVRVMTKIESTLGTTNIHEQVEVEKEETRETEIDKNSRDRRSNARESKAKW